MNTQEPLLIQLKDIAPVPAAGFAKKDIFLSLKNNHIFHYHDFYEISIVLSGSMELQLKESRVRLGAYQIMFLRPFEAHQKYVEPDCIQISVGFSDSVFASAVQYLSPEIDVSSMKDEKKPVILSLLRSDMNIIYHQVRQLYLPLFNDSPTANIALRIFLLQLLTLCFSQNRMQTANNPIPTWLAQLLNIMNEPENFIEGLPAMTKLSGKSHAYLCRIFRQYFNTTPTHYINDKRIRHSLQRLTTTNDDIASIAYDCGFGSVSYFYKYFKETYNMSPVAYRKLSSKIQDLPS